VAGASPFLFETAEKIGDTSRLETPLSVEQLTFGGQGLVRLPGGKVCFVPGVIPGEKVLVRVRRERSSYAEADLVRVVEASPDRLKPPCPVYGRCGGCQYQHIAYPRQLEVKRDQVADVLRRLGGLGDPRVEETVASPLEYAYRNRITVHAKNGKIGFYGGRGKQIVDVAHCPIASDAVNVLLADLRRTPPREGEHPLREPGTFRGFRQVNDAVADLLLGVVEDMAAPGGALLVDAYCGAGFFARRLKEKFGHVVGIEWSVDAVRFARAGAGGNEIYLLGDVKRHLTPALAAAPAQDTTLLLDPPAEGVEEPVLDLIRTRGPAKIIYVSCNPATLARDLKRLGAGYALRRARPVDMFPQTAEIEVATLLEKL